MLTKFCPKMLHNQIDSNMIVSTPGNYYVSILLCWKNEVIKSRFDKLGVLRKDYITLFVKGKLSVLTMGILLKVGKYKKFDTLTKELPITAKIEKEKTPLGTYENANTVSSQVLEISYKDQVT